MENNNLLDLNQFLLRHAKWLKENHSQEEAERFINETLKNFPRDRMNLLHMLRQT